MLLLAKGANLLQVRLFLSLKSVASRSSQGHHDDTFGNQQVAHLDFPDRAEVRSDIAAHGGVAGRDGAGGTVDGGGGAKGTDRGAAGRAGPGGQDRPSLGRRRWPCGVGRSAGEFFSCLQE
ncbi:MAG: hypothetical protein AAF528_04410 [Cyanobacteria bacterium P01_C01_bin.121]